MKKMTDISNLHTHSKFCDGKDEPSEIVKAAISKGFSSIGFSTHSPFKYSLAGCMTEENLPEYKKEIARLKKEYDGIIDIFCGIEIELHSDTSRQGYDYLIGSAHYFKTEDNDYIGFDRSQEVVENIINTHFGGDGLLYAKKYYEMLSEIDKYGNFDIIGHFDIITKHADNIKFFDEESKVYRDYALSCAHALKGKVPFFEVNTGAIARGYRKNIPYPAPFIIKEMKKLGFGVVITSDCHDKNYLDCHFNESRELLAECGFKERYILTKSGFKAVSL